MSDTVRRLRDAHNWLNNGNCCGDKDSYGICAAPACIFGEALKELYDAADRIDTLEAENKALREMTAYIAGTNTDHLQCALAGNPNVIHAVVSRARALLTKEKVS